MRGKLLIFGSNFPLAARIADLIKREFEVIEYAFPMSCESGYKEIAPIFTGEMLSRTLAFHGARHAVFTSEALMYVRSQHVLVGLLEELRACKRLANTWLACVDIAQPIVADSQGRIEVLRSDSAYGHRLGQLRQALDGVADFMLRVQCVYSPYEDPWAANFLHLLFDAQASTPIELDGPDGDWEARTADEVAQNLIARLGFTATTPPTYRPYLGGLSAFCNAARAEYARWADAEILSLPKQDGQKLSSEKDRAFPIHAGLHAVVRQSRCAVNYLYRNPPEAIFGKRSVARFRYELGMSLARSIPREVADDVQMIVPVPETGKLYAQGVAEGLGVPYVEAIFKSDRKRSFDIQSFDVRREFLFSRLAVLPDMLHNKRVMVVDEAIFSGATLSVTSRLLREAGAQHVYFAIPSPEARYACNFNMQPNRSLLSEYVRKEDLSSYFNVQGVFFQDEDSFVQSINQDGPQCMACFIRRGL